MLQSAQKKKVAEVKWTFFSSADFTDFVPCVIPNVTHKYKSSVGSFVNHCLLYYTSAQNYEDSVFSR